MPAGADARIQLGDCLDDVPALDTQILVLQRNALDSGLLRRERRDEHSGKPGNGESNSEFLEVRVRHVGSSSLLVSNRRQSMRRRAAARA
jgi:hypothetical protein